MSTFNFFRSFASQMNLSRSSTPHFDPITGLVASKETNLPGLPRKNTSSASDRPIARQASSSFERLRRKASKLAPRYMLNKPARKDSSKEKRTRSNSVYSNASATSRRTSESSRSGAETTFSLETAFTNQLPEVKQSFAMIRSASSGRLTDANQSSSSSPNARVPRKLEEAMFDNWNPPHSAPALVPTLRTFATATNEPGAERPQTQLLPDFVRPKFINVVPYAQAPEMTQVEHSPSVYSYDEVSPPRSPNTSAPSVAKSYASVSPVEEGSVRSNPAASAHLLVPVQPSNASARSVAGSYLTVSSVGNGRVRSNPFALADSLVAPDMLIDDASFRSRVSSVSQESLPMLTSKVYQPEKRSSYVLPELKFDQSSWSDELFAKLDAFTR